MMHQGRMQLYSPVMHININASFIHASEFQPFLGKVLMQLELIQSKMMNRQKGVGVEYVL